MLSWSFSRVCVCLPRRLSGQVSRDLQLVDLQQLRRRSDAKSKSGSTDTNFFGSVTSLSEPALSEGEAFGKRSSWRGRSLGSSLSSLNDSLSDPLLVNLGRPADFRAKPRQRGADSRPANEAHKLKDKSPPISNDMFTRVCDKLEQHGDWIVTGANVFQLIGFACYDSLTLQSWMILGNSSMALFFISRMQPLKVACGWAVLKVAVNVFMVFSILWYRQPIKLSPEELSVYQEHFMTCGVSARQFKRLWDLGESRTVHAKGTVNVEGNRVQEVSLVVSGYTYKTRKGKHVQSLDSFPGKCNTSSDAGAWSGASTLLEIMDDTGSQLKTVKSDTDKTTNNDEHDRVRHLQHTLAEHGFYEGPLDGYAGKRTIYGLAKFQESFGNDPDSKDLQEMISLHQHILHKSQGQVSKGHSHTTHVKEDATLRVWKVDALTKLSDTDEEMKGALRKAFTRVVIDQSTALLQVEAQPDADGSAGEPILRLYKKGLREALKTGRVLPEDKVVLNQFRKQHRISDRQHIAALHSVAGWTLEEYEHGAQHVALGDMQLTPVSVMLRAGSG